MSTVSPACAAAAAFAMVFQGLASVPRLSSAAPGMPGATWYSAAWIGSENNSENTNKAASFIVFIGNLFFRRGEKAPNRERYGYYYLIANYPRSVKFTRSRRKAKG